MRRTLIRKHANELKAHEKAVWTAIKQDLSPNLNTLDYTIRGVLENKTNETSYPNIGLLKTAIEEEWNKMSEEFFFEDMQIISKVCWYNNWRKMVVILSKFTVL